MNSIWKKKPENNANKVVIAVMDREKRARLLIEGTVCGIGLISDRWKTKQDKYRELRRLERVFLVAIVFVKR